MRVDPPVVVLLAFVAAMALFYGAVAVQRSVIKKVEDAAPWVEFEDSADDRGGRIVGVRRIARYKGDSWIIEDKIVAQIPKCYSQSTRVSDYLTDAYLLARDLNAARGRR